MCNPSVALLDSLRVASVDPEDVRVGEGLFMAVAVFYGDLRFPNKPQSDAAVVVVNLPYTTNTNDSHSSLRLESILYPIQLLLAADKMVVSIEGDNKMTHCVLIRRRRHGGFPHHH